MKSNKSGDRNLGFYLPTLITVCVGVWLSLFAFWAVGKWEKDRLKQRFSELAGQRAQAIQKSVDRHLEALESLKNFFASSSFVERHQFRFFSAGILRRHESVLALEWLPRIIGSQRKLFEKSTRSEGFINFSIDAPLSSEYFPVYYVEPFEENKGRLGFDRAQDILCQEAMRNARERGTAQSTSVLESQTFMVFLPIDQGKNSGFISMSIHVPKLVEIAFASLPSSGMEIILTDATAHFASKPFYTTRPQSKEKGNEFIRLEYRLDVAGRRWIVKCLPTLEFIQNNRVWDAVAVLLIGFLLTALFASHLYSSLSRSREVERLVMSRTQELSIVNQKLHEEAVELEKMSALKDEFIAAVSHELRTPMAVIREGIDLVLGGETGPVNEKQCHFLGIAKRNVDRFARLVNEVLDFQKLESGQMEFKFAEQDLNVVIQDVWESFDLTAKGKALGLLVEFGENLPLVSFDQDKIVQVLTNFVNNAIKFSERGTIVIRSENLGDSVRVSVQDQGPGIREEDIPKLFKSFSQVSGDPYYNAGGTGLGLAISKQIVEKHGGKIGVSSIPEKGSTFYFTLPILTAKI